MLLQKKDTLKAAVVKLSDAGLTPAQRQMYSAEKMMNFRRISKIMATHSSYILSAKDLASPELHDELSCLGQFSEIVYSAIPVEVLFSMMDKLVQPGFPLEGYHVVSSSKLVESFKGKVADLPGYVAYRAATKQLVLAFSGTSTLLHAWHDLRTLTHRHRSGRGAVHSGFWSLYKGVRDPAIEALRKGLESEDVSELVITGHSMGGAVSMLLMLTILADESILGKPSLSLKLVVYGSPRCGDAGMAEYWNELIAARRSKYGNTSFMEYMIKAYNDGVPSLPPFNLGYRHFTREPLYFLWGHLYHIPPSESEHALFYLAEDDPDNVHSAEHPRGGHNYYSGRNLEKFIRRMRWLDSAMSSSEVWENRYRKLIEKNER